MVFSDPGVAEIEKKNLNSYSIIANGVTSFSSTVLAEVVKEWKNLLFY